MIDHLIINWLQSIEILQDMNDCSRRMTDTSRLATRSVLGFRLTQGFQMLRCAIDIINIMTVDVIPNNYKDMKTQTTQSVPSDLGLPLTTTFFVVIFCFDEIGRTDSFFFDTPDRTTFMLITDCSLLTLTDFAFVTSKRTACI